MWDKVGNAKIADSMTVSISDLQLWDRNPRSIKGDRFNELKERLKRQGQIKPLLVAADGVTVIGGNMRLRALKELGIAEVWISQTEAVTDKEIFDLALTDNEEFGYYEQEQVAELALELGLSPIELKSYSLSLGAPTTLDLVIDKFGPEPEEDEVPEVDETETISVLGEVYQLGSHRLMCGDSTDADAVAELMDGAKISAIITDPPYGMNLDTDYSKLPSTSSEGNRSYSKVIGDDKQFDYQEYSWIDVKEQIWFGCQYYAKTLPDEGSWLVWDKRVEDKFDAMIGSAFELAWSKIPHKQKIYRYNNTLFGGDSEARGKEHPTQKPTKLMFEVIKDYTNVADIVLDLFGGSGSTLIACEQTNRICYMMELDPKYVDVIRKRYANHIGEGESWQEATPAITAKELQHASR